MPLRRNDQLWANLPGIVAAYQPVRAPGPLLARYNMAHGGDNRWRLSNTAQPPPSWNSRQGYVFDGAAPNSLYISSVTNSLPALQSALIRFVTSNTPKWKQEFKFGMNGGETAGIPVMAQFYGQWQFDIDVRFHNHPAAGVQGQAGTHCFGNGSYLGEYATYTAAAGLLFSIGNAYCSEATNTWGSYTGDILAVAIYARELTFSEVWTVSRQMAYCDVNPDWSVWGRRRQWYYGAQPGSFQAAWARGSNVVLRGGP